MTDECLLSRNNEGNAMQLRNRKLADSRSHSLSLSRCGNTCNGLCKARVRDLPVVFYQLVENKGQTTVSRQILQQNNHTPHESCFVDYSLAQESAAGESRLWQSDQKSFAVAVSVSLSLSLIHTGKWHGKRHLF